MLSGATSLAIAMGGRATMSERSGSVTPDQRRMLAVLLERPGKALTRGQLLDAVFADRPDAPRPNPRTVDVQISHLRSALGADSEIEINTIWGKGYAARKGNDQ
jgi:DNA-binding response OmpR family regulator